MREVSWATVLTGVWISLGTIASLVTLVPWFVALMMLPLLFDSGWNEKNTRFLVVVLAFPSIPLLSTMTAWLLFAFKQNRWAAIAVLGNLAPIAWVASVS